jgi:Rod binding domain-containing protein
MAFAVEGFLSADHAKADKLGSSDAKKLREACQGFESLFIHKMMQAMRQATMEGELIKKTNAEKIFTDMMDEEMSNEAAKASQGGIADMLYESMKWTVEDGEKLAQMTAGAQSKENADPKWTADSVLGELNGLRAANRKEIPSANMLPTIN